MKATELLKIIEERTKELIPICSGCNVAIMDTLENEFSNELTKIDYTLYINEKYNHNGEEFQIMDLTIKLTRLNITIQKDFVYVYNKEFGSAWVR